MVPSRARCTRGYSCLAAGCGKRNPLTLDECRHRVKYWLYIGIGLANDAKDSRKRHLDFRPRHLELTMSEAELDALVMQ